VELLGAGYDFRVFSVGTGTLFRFPQHPKAVPKLEIERRLLTDLGDHLSLPVPRYEFDAGCEQGATNGFVRYRMLPGVGADAVDTIDRRAVARQLGHFLGELHAYPVDRARAVGVPVKADIVARWRDENLARLEDLVDPDIDRLGAQRFLEEGVPPSYQGELKLAHTDLWPENVLIDDHSGIVSGVIDWGDAMICDPAVDFAALGTWYGERWMGSVLRHYPAAADPDMLLRARYLAVCLAVCSIAMGRERGVPRWIEAGREAMKRVLEPVGPLDGIPPVTSVLD
jgi:aminoglycoside phosphotransferase (APT) family kinase protein